MRVRIDSMIADCGWTGPKSFTAEARSHTEFSQRRAANLCASSLSLCASAVNLPSIILLVSFLLLLGPAPQAATVSGNVAQGEKEVSLLEPGRGVERELSGGEVHSYQIMLTAGQYLHVIVEQRSIDVVVALRGPDGAQLAEMDALGGMIGAEELVWEAAGSGGYVLEVRARARQSNKGRYEVRLQQAAGAGDRERARITAQQLFMEGKRAQEEGRGAGLERAVKKYEEAVAKWREAGERKWEGLTLNSLAGVYWNLGQYEKAREYFDQVLTIWREIKDRRGEGLTLNNLGLVYWNLGQYEKAREYYEQALAIRPEIKDRSGEAAALNNLGIVYGSLSQYEKAREYFEQALTIRREIKDRSGEGSTLYGIARVERDRGKLGESRAQIEAALAIIESLRTNIATQELRTSYFASVQDYYELYTDLLMRLHKQRPAEGHEAAALETSERARARSLVELLTEASTDIRHGVDPALLERERALRQQLDAKAERQIRLLSGRHTKEQAAAAAKEIDALTTEYQQAQARIRTTSPRYAALTQPQPLTLKEIQQQVLDPDTLMLEYALGGDRSYLWAVTQSGITSYELPKRAEIETAAKRFYELLTQPNQQSSGARLAARAPRSQALTEAAARLSQMLLAPVASQLSKKRLLIVADGTLQYVPFAALPAPVVSGQWSGVRGQSAVTEVIRPAQNWQDMKRRSQSARLQPGMRGIISLGKNLSPTPGPRPLVVDHEVVSLPSASTLAILRRETADRKPAPKTIAILADPVFTEDDPRVRPIKPTNTADQQTDAAATRSLIHAKASKSAAEFGLELVRLPGTRREARNLLGLVAPSERMQALDFAASRETATSDKLSQYRIVHFATHGLLNTTHPDLSGIVLSLVDEQGKPRNGFLLAHELFNLNLPAELVVVSACRTGLGKEIRGEGLVGMTRALMYAGARRVVVSLWNVSDEATAELMARFYRGMLKGGLRPAAALRAAQIQMWRSSRWRSPQFWAGFVLQGEWK